MRKVLGFGKVALKVLFIGAVIVSTVIMNFIGAIICAVTNG
jgi:hypothetical protein